MIYEIRKYGDPVLRKVAEKVEDINDEIREILSNMLETMYATDGECLFVMWELRKKVK